MDFEVNKQKTGIFGKRFDGLFAHLGIQNVKIESLNEAKYTEIYLSGASERERDSEFSKLTN